MLDNMQSTKVKIAFVTDKYHWSSYSGVRSLYEEFDRQHDVQLCWEDIAREDTELILLVGANATVSGVVDVPIVRIALSDPNLYSDRLWAGCALYVTNDYNMYETIPSYYMPCFSDNRYFKNLGLEKETDILFVGVKEHPYIGNRGEVVTKLRAKGFHVKCFGHGWDWGFIEGDQLVEEINKAHLCLDITNTTTALGSRIFQSSMCGTPVVTRYREDLYDLFGESLLYYSDSVDLYDTIEVFNRTDCLPYIGESARKKCVERHDVSVRVRDLMEHIYDKGLLRPVSRSV